MIRGTVLLNCAGGMNTKVSSPPELLWFCSHFCANTLTEMTACISKKAIASTVLREQQLSVDEFGFCEVDLLELEVDLSTNAG